MTEDALLRLVLAECERLGLWVYHSTDSRRDVGPGFPDLTIAGPRGYMWRELKSRTGKLRPDQLAWGIVLKQGGGSWDVWRPGDWPVRIAAELTALTLH